MIFLVCESFQDLRDDLGQVSIRLINSKDLSGVLVYQKTKEVLESVSPLGNLSALELPPNVLELVWLFVSRDLLDWLLVSDSSGVSGWSLLE